MSTPPPNRRTAASRRLIALAAFAAAAFVGGLLTGVGDGENSGAVDGAEEAGIELPRGGRSLLPDHRLVGFYGAPQSEELGALGIGTPSQASVDLLEQAGAYRGKRPEPPILPVFGFKLFYREDVNLMSPAQVLDLRPTPDLIVYE